MERCEKFPSIPQIYCSHCQGTAQSTTPVYTVLEDQFGGYPVIEILKNGGPIHRYDSHFRFGTRKARMVVACEPILRDFGWATDDEKRQFDARVVTDDSLAIAVNVWVEMFPEFEYSTGDIIERPYLQLSTPSVHIGLGAAKCRALWVVRRELRAWVTKHNRHH